MKTIAIQGQIASFHHEAAERLVPESHQLLCCESFAAVFEALEHNTANLAVVAVQNTAYGPIGEVAQLLATHKPHQLSSLVLPIEQCLIGMPGTKLADITEVYSHKVALKQCSIFLDQHLAHARQITHHDTAGAVADIAAWKESSKAAIASEYAARQYRLAVLARSIQNNANNSTTFVLLSKHADR